MKNYEIRMSKDRLNELKKETETDEVLHQVLKMFYIRYVKLKKNKEECQELKNYYNNRSEIQVNNGIVYFGERIQRYKEKLV